MPDTKSPEMSTWTNVVGNASDLTFIFNEPIKIGLGKIELRYYQINDFGIETGDLIETYRVNNGNTSNVFLGDTNDTLRIIPNIDLAQNTEYSIVFYYGSVTDISGNILSPNYQSDSYVFKLGSGTDYSTDNTSLRMDLIKDTVTLISTGKQIGSLKGIKDATATKGNDILIGDEFPNKLQGKEGDDLFDGRFGEPNDTLIGDIGNDTYQVDSTAEIISENSGEGTDTVEASLNYTLGDNLEKLTLVGTDSLTGIGNTLKNTLLGNDSDNLLNGGDNKDTLIGGNGNDTYIIDSNTDMLIEMNNGGNDTVSSSIEFQLNSNFENLVLLGTNSINGYGNILANSLVGNNANNTLDDGQGGDDTLIGNGGDDTYRINSSNSVISEQANQGNDIVSSTVSFTLPINVETLLLFGSATNGKGNEGNNSIRGNDADNLLEGGGGIDTLKGGRGNDTYLVVSNTDIIFEDYLQGTDVVSSSISFTLLDNIETLVLSGSNPIDGSGNATANQIIGNIANNVLIGGAGIDTLIGDAGDDTYLVDSTAETISELPKQGIDTVQSTASFTLGDNVEILVLTGTKAITGVGNNVGNTIIGNDNANLLQGGLGKDDLRGGDGNDIYVVDSTNDVMSEAVNQGIDTVSIAAAFTLADNFENLMLLANAINGTGNGVKNTLTGNGADNILDGGASDDVLIGQTGNDTYLVDSVNDKISELANEGSADTIQTSVNYSLSQAKNVENLTFTGIGNVELIGNSENNVLTANNGNDSLEGGDGVDTLIGGLGDDTYTIDTTTDSIIEVENGGNDTIRTNQSYTLTVANIENITLLRGAGKINATGNSLNNLIQGNGVDNILDGGGGTDTLIGNEGFDTYVVDSTTDVISELADEGLDTVSSSVSYSLGEHLDNLVLTGTTAINATGNSLKNILTGNDGNNIFDGGEGFDVLNGGLGNDTYLLIDSTSDPINETTDGGSADTIQTNLDYNLSSTKNVENLVYVGTNSVSLLGNSANNLLVGNSGNDTFNGAEGIDTLIGGLGDDYYSIDTTTDTLSEEVNAGTDTIVTSISYTLTVANIENITLLRGAGKINATGNNLNNLIQGNGVDNILDGGDGTDTLAGGLDNDTYFIDSSSDVLSENAGEGIDSVSSSVTYTLTDNIENLVLFGNNALNATGNSSKNILIGNNADNVLDGGNGSEIDTLIGGAGNDTYIVSNTTDVFIEQPDGGNDSVLSSNTFSFDNPTYVNIENIILGGDRPIDATGNTLPNLLVGNNAGNRLIGGSGIDTLIGGLGDDDYVVNTTADVISELIDQGNDTISTRVDFVLSDNTENLFLIGTSNAINGSGNNLANNITGNDFSNSLIGLEGNDSLIGAIGADTLEGGIGDDTLLGGLGLDNLSGGAGNDSLDGGAEPDTLNGGASDDTLNGGGGNDILIGGEGSDAMSGGTVEDTYYVDSSLDTVTENLNEGIDIVFASASFTLSANVEYLTLTGTDSINATGNELNNSIAGNIANNILDGGDGKDILVGSLGDDTYRIDSTMDSLIELAGEGNDSIETLVNYTLSNSGNIENLTLIGNDPIEGTGNNTNNLIIGNNRNNLLNGSVGDDTLKGGLGDDVYFVDSANDLVQELSNEGIDEVRTKINYTLPDNIENLTLIVGISDLSVQGNSLNNKIEGNYYPNLLDGSLGDDTLVGYNNGDIYVVNSTGDIIIENAGEGTDTVSSLISYSLTDNVENLTLIGTDTINATGNSLKNELIGNSANNLLDAGNDTYNTLMGGDGNDTYVYYSNTDTFVENAGQGIDSILSSVNFTLGSNYKNIEGIILGGSGELNAIGDELDNILIGNDNNNVLKGDLGNDTLQGGKGNDTYFVNTLGDIVIENDNEGNADLISAGTDFTLPNNVENLILTSTNSINGNGNSLANTLTGNAYANSLFGDNGDDNLSGNVGNDTLSGGGGNDSLSGGSNDDLLIGGLGADILTGSENVDTFLFNVLDGAADHLTDFSIFDKIELDATIFTQLTKGALPVNEFISGNNISEANDNNDYLIYDKSNGNLYYDADANGSDQTPIQIAIFDNAFNLTNSYFTII